MHNLLSVIVIHQAIYLLSFEVSQSHWKFSHLLYTHYLRLL